MHADPFEDPTITDAQICARLKIDHSTLWRWRQRGEAPPSYKFGRKRLTSERDYREWRASRREAA